MFLNRPNLRGVGESHEMTPEELQEFFKCAEDIIYFAEKYFYIVNIDEGKHKIQLYDFQRKALKVFTSPTVEGRKNAIVLMPRQMGKSTMSSVYLAHFMLFNQDKVVAILANKEAAAQEVLRRVKGAYGMFPLWMQQGIQKWNEKSIELENGMRMLAATTSSDSISGETVSLLYLDEFAKVKPHVAEEFITATLPVVSSGEKSKVIIVSTPLGMNHYYSYWRGATEQDESLANNFFPIKVNWWEHPKRDAVWKAEVLKTFNNDLSKFNQEFGCRFLGSSDTLIDPDILERMDISKPIDMKYNGSLKIYEHPIQNAVYALGVDTGKGTGRDYSVIQILKIISEENIVQVAVYRENMVDTYNFSQVCIGISQFYNEAYMMVENNGIGEAVCNTIWYDFEYDKIANIDKKGLGIRSTTKTKLKANLLVKRYLDNNMLTVHDEDTILEFSKYIEKRPNVFQAETRSTHDDCVTSLLWGLYFITTSYFDGANFDVRELDEEYDLRDSGPIMFFPT